MLKRSNCCQDSYGGAAKQIPFGPSPPLFLPLLTLAMPPLLLPSSGT